MLYCMQYSVLLGEYDWHLVYNNLSTIFDIIGSEG